MSLPDPAHQCCQDFTQSGISRRSLLKRAGAVGAAALATQVFGEAVLQSSYGATLGGNVLVVLSLRGGIDGLGLVVPHGDPGYYAARPNIAIPADSLVAADEMFGLHPAMAPLQPLWDAGGLAAVHAVGLAVPNRSHFAAIEEVEDAAPGSTARSGWVNRMVGLGPAPHSTDAVQLGTSIAPSMLTGPNPVLATSSLSALQVPGLGAQAAARYASLATAWGPTNTALGRAAREAVALSKGPGATLNRAVAPVTAYPTAGAAADLAAAMRSAAQLVRADVGAEIITIDFSGWDIHANYGTARSGPMQIMVDAFASTLAAFMADLESMGSRVTVVTISEFGRRVRENGSRGLDHGWGNMMLLAGAGVRGGQYYGQWPGLDAGEMTDGDLKVTTDYRDVLGEVISVRFPNRSLAQVFPGLTYAPRGILTAA